MGRCDAYFLVVQYILFVDGVLSIFIDGDYPGCDAPWVRNTYNVQFCRQSSDIIQRHFSLVQKIPGITHDADFPTLVMRFNMRRLVVFDPAIKMDMKTMRKWILDWHPNISYFNKMFSHMDLATEPLEIIGRYSWNEVREANNVAYIIDYLSIHIDHTTGAIAYKLPGRDDDFNLQQYTIDLQDDGEQFPYLLSYNDNIVILTIILF